MAAIREIWMYQTGRARASRNWLESGGGREGCWLPFLNWLVVHEEHGPILVDAGLGDRALERQARWWGRAFMALTRTRLSEDMALRARVAQCGVDPDAVRHGILTHMHYDLTCGVADLPAVTWQVDAEEWRSAHGKRGLVRGYLRSDFADARVAHYEWRESTEYEPFARAADLFGDGSVVLLPTPGHSAGHASVLLRAGSRRLLLVGDAAFTVGSLTRGRGLGWFPRRVADDLGRAELTLEQLRAFLKRNPDVEPFPSHDPDIGEDATAGPTCLYRAEAAT